MPQMAPLGWLSLMLLFSFMCLFMICLLYFNYGRGAHSSRGSPAMVGLRLKF